jgi:acyl carrier protein
VNTTDRIRRYLSEELKVSEPTDDLALIDGGILDSLGIFQTVTFLEDEFDIQIDDDELIPDNFATIGSIAALVDSKLG